MAQNLHSSEAWEELAEDPFRGLRAGPASFSPFSLLPRLAIRNPSGRDPSKRHPNFKVRQKCALHRTKLVNNVAMD
jgi:hypothetical protein